MLSDEQIDEILGAAYTRLVRETGYNGGMGGLTWDRAAARAIESALSQSTEQGERRERNLAMMIRMLCSYGNTDSMKKKATDLLRLYDLQGSPLRGAAMSPHGDGGRG